MSDGLKLLAAIIENNSTVTFGILEHDDFVDEEVRVYDYVVRHRRRHGAFPSLDTLEDETGVEIPDPTEVVDYYLSKVYDRKFYNDLRPRFMTMRNQMMEGNMDAVREGIADLSRIARRNEPVQRLMTIGEAAESALEAYRRAQAVGDDITGIPTGHEYLDKETGGWQNGDLIYFVARPSIGKTWELLNNVRAAQQARKSVLVVSTEMPTAQITTRYLSMLAGVNPMLARRGKLCMWSYRRFETMALSFGGDNSIHIYGAGFAGRVGDIDILIQELSPDFVAIDGAYLLKPNSTRAMGRYEAIAHAVDDLKQVTLTRNRPIFCTTQFGRSADKGGKNGSLETIGYTDTIGTHSSIVLGAKASDPITQRYTDEYGREKYRTFSQFREIDVLKGREGEQGSFWHRFSLCPFDFSEVDQLQAAGRTEAPDLSYM